ALPILLQSLKPHSREKCPLCVEITGTFAMLLLAPLTFFQKMPVEKLRRIFFGQPGIDPVVNHHTYSLLALAQTKTGFKLNLLLKGKLFDQPLQFFDHSVGALQMAGTPHTYRDR